MSPLRFKWMVMPVLLFGTFSLQVTAFSANESEPGQQMEVNGNSELQKKFQEYLAGASSVSGQGQAAIEDYNRASLRSLYTAYAEADAADVMRPRVLREIAALHYYLEDFEKSASVYDEATEIAPAIEDRIRAKVMAANVWSHLAKSDTKNLNAIAKAAEAAAAAFKLCAEAGINKQSENLLEMISIQIEMGCLRPETQDKALAFASETLSAIGPKLPEYHKLAPDQVVALLLQIASKAGPAKNFPLASTVCDQLVGLEGKQSPGYFVWQCADYLDPEMKDSFQTFVSARVSKLPEDAWKKVLGYYMANGLLENGRFDKALPKFLEIATLDLSDLQGVYPALSRPESILEDARLQATLCLHYLGDHATAEMLTERFKEAKAPPATEAVGKD